MARSAKRVVPSTAVDVVKADPSDNRIIDCAVAAGSGCIVSGDKHLLKLGQYEGIKIMRVADFLREILPGRER
jgi:predicted nucleic acid-binding protein